MLNRNMNVLRGMLAPGAQVQLAPEIANPYNIPQINAPSLQERLASNGYQSFGQQAAAPGSNLAGALQTFAQMVPQQQENSYPQIQPQAQASYGAQQLPGMLGQGLNVPSAFPQMPDPVAARQQAAVQGALSPDVMAPQPIPQEAPQASQVAAPSKGILSNPAFLQGLQAFGQAFSDIGARPGVSFGSALGQHLKEAQDRAQTMEQQQAIKALRQKIAQNPNIDPMAIARAVAAVDPVKGAEMMINAQKAQASMAGLQSAYGKAVRDAQIIGQTYGLDSPQYKEALANASRVASGSGVSLDVDPNTGAISFQQGSSLGRGGAAQIVDGKLVSAPGRGTQTFQQQRQLMSAGRDVALKYAKNPYVGSGSNKQLLDDRLAYKNASGKRKKELGDKLVKAAVAHIVAPDAIALALSSQKIPVTNMSQRSMESGVKQGWAEGTGLLVNNLPPELQNRAREEANKVLQEISRQQDLVYARGFPIDVSQKPKTIKWKVENGQLVRE